MGFDPAANDGIYAGSSWNGHINYFWNMSKKYTAFGVSMPLLKM
jgi:hypothetical protein